jgi:hypothetical protein
MMVAELFASLGLKADKGSFDKGTNLIGGIKKALAGILAIEAVKKLADIVMGTIDLGGHLDDLRQKTGLTAESLQAYGYAAKLGGSDLDGFAAGVTKLSRTLQEAKGGSADASKSLREAGLTSAAVTAALKGGDGLDAALQEIADKFADMSDGPKKTALAMQIFGKSGAELIPTLNRGGDGLRDLKKEAYDLGVVMSENNVSAADDLGDNIDKLKMSAVGLKNQAIAALLPVLKTVVDNTLAWVKANKQLIIDKLTGAVNVLITVLGYLGDAVGVVVDIFDWFGDHTEIAQALLIALGVVIGTFAVEAAIAWALAFWPLVLAVAVIAGIILGVKALYHWITEGKGPVATALRWIGGKFVDLWNKVKDIGGRIVDFFADFSGNIKKYWGEAMDWIADKAQSTWEKLQKLPVIKQAIEAGHGVGDVARRLAGKDSLYISDELAAQREQGFTGTQEEFEQRRAANLAKRGIGVAPTVEPQRQFGPEPHRYIDGAAGDTTTSQTNIGSVSTSITVNAPNADPKEVAKQVDTRIQEHWNSQMRAAHAGTGGADQ